MKNLALRFLILAHRVLSCNVSIQKTAFEKYKFHAYIWRLCVSLLKNLSKTMQRVVAL